MSTKNPFNLFCKHHWKMISETTTKSKFERSLDALKVCEGEVNLPGNLCGAESKHIQTFACIKCGTFKRFVEKI